MRLWPSLWFIAFFILFLIFHSQAYACEGWSWCGREEASEPSRTYLTNGRRQITGDIYNPGNGGRVQIRDKHRRIIGYIEPGGLVTDTRHRPTDAAGALTNE